MKKAIAILLAVCFVLSLSAAAVSATHWQPPRSNEFSVRSMSNFQEAAQTNLVVGGNAVGGFSDAFLGMSNAGASVEISQFGIANTDNYMSMH